MARCRGEPLIALPIFPLRMFIQPYIYCTVKSNIKSPADLKGKMLGMEQYRFTVGLWARGILKEHHGVKPSDIYWITADHEGAGYRFPADINIHLQGNDVESLLLNGDIDALISANVPKSYREGDPRIVRVFGDCRLAVQEYFAKTGIFPITHTLVMKESLYRNCPWMVDSVGAAFDDADRLCRQKYHYPKRFSFPTAVLFLEEEELRFGKNPWIQGLEPNRVVLEKFVEYAEDQGYISFRPRVDELFAHSQRMKTSAYGDLAPAL
jgi:4,5-dihydroxyphthalate decarboxylase